MTHNHLRGRRIAASIALALAAGSVPAMASAAGGPASQGCTNRNLNSTDKLLQCIDGDDVLGHLEALQGIADANGGTRASGTPGYDASADYVAGLLEEAGFTVQRQVFDFSLFTEITSFADRRPVPTSRRRPSSTRAPATSPTAT